MGLLNIFKRKTDSELRVEARELEFKSRAMDKRRLLEERVAGHKAHIRELKYGPIKKRVVTAVENMRAVARKIGPVQQLPDKGVRRMAMNVNRYVTEKPQMNPLSGGFNPWTTSSAPAQAPVHRVIKRRRASTPSPAPVSAPAETKIDPWTGQNTSIFGGKKRGIWSNK